MYFVRFGRALRGKLQKTQEPRITRHGRGVGSIRRETSQAKPFAISVGSETRLCFLRYHLLRQRTIRPVTDDLLIRVIRVIAAGSDFISTFPRTVFGKWDRRAKVPDRIKPRRAGVIGVVL